jgi:hypothetical protein
MLKFHKYGDAQEVNVNVISLRDPSLLLYDVHRLPGTLVIRTPLWLPG